MRARLRKLLGRALGRSRQRRIPGLPAGLERSELEEICLRERGTGIAQVSHEHLSAWKESGSFRLFLVDGRGARWQVIYKRADYRHHEIPALEGFPLRPGPPEAAVLNGARSVRPHLPKVHLSRESRESDRFDYLLEDLSTSHRVAGPNDCLRCAALLPDLQRSLAEDFTEPGGSRLLRFDGPFWQDLVPYAERALQRFASQYPESGAGPLAERLPALDALRSRILDSEEGTASVALHGDYNVTNILVPRGSGKLAVIDWEWAGFGLPQADLASLLKGVERGIEEQALDVYVRACPATTPARHLELYRWSQIERGVLDASFLANQSLDAQHRSGLDLPSCVRSSAALVDRYVRELQQ